MLIFTLHLFSGICKINWAQAERQIFLISCGDFPSTYDFCTSLMYFRVFVRVQQMLKFNKSYNEMIVSRSNVSEIVTTLRISFLQVFEISCFLFS